MPHDFTEECLVCALNDLECLAEHADTLQHNDHLAEAERHLRLLWSELQQSQLHEMIDGFQLAMQQLGEG